MLTPLFCSLAYIVGMVVGAYSHKYLASEVTKVTGLNADVKIVNPLQVQPPKA